MGIGPGAMSHMTPRAREAILSSEYVLGNDTYLKQIPELLDGKHVIKSRMGEEVERAKRAMELAKEHRVCMVSGGDANVYGMASIVLEVLEREKSGIEIEIVPGISALNACASLVGAPLTTDFAVISLSDLLTPWTLIEKRLEAAAYADFVIVLFNPKSRGRSSNFKRAVEIIRKHRRDAPIGLVKNGMRTGEKVVITQLKDIDEYNEFVDMHTTVIVGNSESRVWSSGKKDYIITPRGYHRKYSY
ncbi:MAG: precorrin-3B C(17)-methyltransferase [Methermicoccaceae archaeon]